MLLITYQLLLAASFFNHNIMEVVRNCTVLSTCRFQMSQLIAATLPRLVPNFYFLVNWVWLGWS